MDNIPFGACLPELDNMEDSWEFMYHLQQTPSYTESIDSFSSPHFESYPDAVITRDHSISGVLQKQDSHTANTTISLFAPIAGSSTNNFTISFGDFTSPTAIKYQNQLHDVIKFKGEMNLDEVLASIKPSKKVSGTKRNHTQAQEHVLAERKRREKLNQRFMSLYTLLPEIKKMDKATVLEDAYKYIEYLQNRVKQLEETSMSKKNVIQETTITSTKKSKFHELAYASSSNTTYNPEIKVRILGCNVLVRIYCQKNSLLPLKALTEMEGLHFTIIFNSVLPISSTSALITIIAQTSEEFAMTAKDLVKCLRLSFLKLQ